jgi:hypothetical protein
VPDGVSAAAPTVGTGLAGAFTVAERLGATVGGTSVAAAGGEDEVDCSEDSFTAAPQPARIAEATAPKAV